ncbi:MAG: lipocalin family protein [Bacteroidales bacterium]|nr:lipocalin family protein [Bacteroidales bacterium]
MKRLFTLIAMAALSVCCMAQKVDNSTITNLEPERYLGKWYEIARYDHKFERGLNYATANYSLMNDGKIRVVNSGLKNGKLKSSVGKAKFTDNPGLLRVSFFGPFYSDYRIMMLSKDYKYALVGSKSAKYLWILSRTPAVPEGTLNHILVEAANRGYDISKLIWVKQGVPETEF